MQKRNLVVVGAALGALLAAAAPARAETYLRGEIAGGFGDKYQDAPAGDLEDSMRYGGAIGTNVSPNVRVEAEYFHSRGDFEFGGGESKANVGMANVYYDFAPDAGLNPFVGAGVGYGKFEPTGGEDNGVAYQAVAGVSTRLSDRITGEVAYKFVEAPDLDIGAAETSFQSSYVGAGVRLKLGN